MKRLIAVGLIALSGALVCAAKDSKHTSQGPQKNDAGTVAAEGEQRFQTHCGRCHQAPEDLSPRTAPAVLRHMRVRAMLTREDEQLILQYIAPR